MADTQTSDPQLKELDDGSLAAFFDADMNMVDENDPKAEIVHIIKPDGTSIWGVKQPADKAPTKQ